MLRSRFAPADSNMVKNRLEGTIPESLCRTFGQNWTMSSGVWLAPPVGVFLTNNMLNGTLPACIQNMTGLLFLCVRFACALVHTVLSYPPACAEISAIINFRGRSRMYLQIWVVMLRRHRHRRHRRRRPRHCLQAFQPGRLFLPHLGLQECRMRQAGPLRCQTRKSGASLAWAYCA